MTTLINEKQKILYLLTQALEALDKRDPSRENSLAKTKLEEAIMWHNKDRTVKGELKPTKTHRTSNG